MSSGDVIDVYMLLGQSNMVGHNRIEPEDQVTHPRILAMDREGRWTPATNPLRHEQDHLAGVGPGLSFARAMATADERITVGLIPCARDGSALRDWSKGAELYVKAVARARLAMQRGRMKGALWLQGEAEAKSEVAARTYLKRLTRMIADLREDLDAPDLSFVVGEIDDFPINRPFRPCTGGVREALARVSEQVGQAGFVTCQGLGDGGEGHFDARSMREYGLRFADEMLRIQAGNSRGKTP